jgi:hypothetical protein
VIRTTGKCRVNAVAAGEVHVNLLGLAPAMSAKFVLVNSETGDRFGSTDRNTNWSDETMKRLAALVESMEKDAAASLFEESQDEAPSPSTHVFDNTLGDGVASL